MIFALRELLQDFPALPSLQCVVSAISLSSTPHSEDPLNENATSETSSAEGAPTSTKPIARSVITPPENTMWSSAQLAPFVQRLAPGQPIEGTVVPFNNFITSWSEVEFSSGYYYHPPLHIILYFVRSFPSLPDSTIPLSRPKWTGP